MTVERWVEEIEGVGTFARVRHVGPDRHDELRSGEQCECGWIALGREPSK